MLSRYRGPGGVGQFFKDLAVAGSFLNGVAAVGILALVCAGLSEEPIADWFQAIGAPAAVGVAFWAAWYQAERAHRSARQILEAQLREQATSRVRRARRELISAHGALEIAAITMNANIRQFDDDPAAKLDPERPIHLDSIVARLRFFEAPTLEADVYAVTTELVAQLDALTSRMRHALGKDEPVSVLFPFIAQVSRVVMGSAHRVEAMLHELEAESVHVEDVGSFNVRRSVDEWKFTYDWERFFHGWTHQRCATSQPSSRECADVTDQRPKAP